MAATAGRPEPSLIARLLAEPHRFSFFQAVRLLEMHRTDSVGVGRQGPPAEEAVAMGVDPALGFPKSDLVAVESIDRDGRPAYRLTTSFLGLHGSSSPLPTFYAEDVLHDDSSDGALCGFLDVFHHRILSLFYRCWLRCRYHFQFKAGGTDEFSRAIFALLGMGERGLIESTGFPATRLLHFAGLLTQKPHSASALTGIVHDYFGGVPVRIIQAIGRWLRINREQRAKLGVKNCRLGEDLCLGERIYDRLSKFRMVLGPLDFETYTKFLPGGEYHKTIKSIVRQFAVDVLDFDFELILSAGQTPKLGLDLTGKSRLGWTTGFYAEKFARKDVSVVFA